MRIRVAFLTVYVLISSGAAFAQGAEEVAPEVALPLEIPSPGDSTVSNVDIKLSVEQLAGIRSDVPTSRLSRIAQQPLQAAAMQTRSAKNAQIYRTASPSVVLIATKDGLGSGSLIGGLVRS